MKMDRISYKHRIEDFIVKWVPHVKTAEQARYWYKDQEDWLRESVREHVIIDYLLEKKGLQVPNRQDFRAKLK